MEQHPRQTFRRNPFEILGECFRIYGRHFRKFLLIALIVQVPTTAVETTVFASLPTFEGFESLQEGSGGGSPEAQSDETTESTSLDAFPIGGFFGMMLKLIPYLAFASVASTVLNGAFAVAVAQQYATGTVSVGGSYGRTWWRVLTLLVLGLIMFGAIVLMLVGALFIVPAIVVMVVLVYWSVTAQAVVLEGYKPIGALKRSWNLVRSNWWRTFGAWLLAGLVTLGLVVLLSLVLMAPLNLMEEAGDFLKTVIGFASGVATGALVTPILGIVGVLIYLDLRSENEEYTLDELTEQMGIASHPDEYGMDAQ